ncbi:hypothetical protein CesoFtcFv8_022528 [Champsocephalus esox]|nr:hypothetical protein CesoFtcFv8_022528 [Champsocephalus esox]
MECVHQGDWCTSIDLKDAYFHITIIPKHRKFLRFSFQGISYQYNRLSFGYSLAPRTFSKCVETALEPLRRGGMRVLFYLDDLLLLARSREEAALQTVQLVSHLSSLGFIINWEKSCPLPSQIIMYLGMEFNSARMRARLSQRRVENLTALLRRVTPGRVVTALSVMQLLGMMSAGHVVIPLGLLYMRRLQRWFIRLRIDPVRQRRRGVCVPPSVGLDLTYWKNPHVLSVGVPLGRVTSHTSVFTDASLSGWGGTCMSQAVGGTVAAAHVPSYKRAGITHRMESNPALRPVAVESSCDDSDRQQNGGSLHKSSGRCTISAAAGHSQAAVVLGAHTHDLDQSNVYSWRAEQRGGPHVQRRSLRRQDHPPLGVDAFAHRPWPRVLLYAFPPVPLIPRFLDRVQEERLVAVLIAPERTGASWFPCMQRMLSGRPWEIPWRRDALSQVEGAISGHPVLGQRLWAWPLNGNT